MGGSDEVERSGASGAELLRRNLEAAFAGDARAAHRLGKAETSVSLRSGSGPVATLLLDRDPPELSDDEHAEITLELDAEQLEAFAHGRLVVANCLVLGAAPYKGPVRKYLAVDPILRQLLRRAAGEDPA